MPAFFEALWEVTVDAWDSSPMKMVRGVFRAFFEELRLAVVLGAALLVPAFIMGTVPHNYPFIASWGVQEFFGTALLIYGVIRGVRNVWVMAT